MFKACVLFPCYPCSLGIGSFLRASREHAKSSKTRGPQYVLTKRRTRLWELSSVAKPQLKALDGCANPTAYALSVLCNVHGMSQLVMWVELCLPKRYFEALSPGLCKCDLMWTRSVEVIRFDEVIRVRPQSAGLVSF